MKVKILFPVFSGVRGFNPGDIADVPPMIAEAWLSAGKAKQIGAVSSDPVVVTDPVSVDTVETVDSLCQKYTVAQLRQIYEKATGKKAHHNQNEKTLAKSILEAGK